MATVTTTYPDWQSCTDHGGNFSVWFRGGLTAATAGSVGSGFETSWGIRPKAKESYDVYLRRTAHG